MSTSNSIAPHLPYLRRFARALTGSQAEGDACVVATLEAIVNDPATLADHMLPRVALYKAFLDNWQTAQPPAGARERTGKPQTAAEKRLAVLTPVSRQAFLLMSVEGFSPRETGLILGLPEKEINALIDTIGAEIARQMATDVLIIEDEPLIAMDLSELVELLGHRVAATARTHNEAVAAFAAHRPGLILADIQLADGSSGVSAVNEILSSFAVPVIFITAFPERLLTGERPEPAFLITKPFDAAAVRAIVSQSLFFDMRSHRST